MKNNSLSLILALLAPLAALAASMSGSWNTWIGNSAGTDTDAERTTVVGAGTGAKANGITKCTYVGTGTGQFTTNCANVTAVGYGVARRMANVTNYVTIGDCAIFDGWNNAFYLRGRQDAALTNSPIYYANGILHLNANEVNINGSTTTGGGSSSGGSSVTVGQYDFYVDPVNGDDAFSGTSVISALKTINGAIAKLSAHGQTVCLLAGTYASPTADYYCQKSNPVRGATYRTEFFAPYGPSQTIIDGGGTRYILGCITNTFTTFHDCTFQNLHATNVNRSAALGICFSNCTFSGDLYFTGASRNGFTSCYFQDCRMNISVNTNGTPEHGENILFLCCDFENCTLDIAAPTNFVLSSSSRFYDCAIETDPLHRLVSSYVDSSVLGNPSGFYSSTLLCSNAVDAAYLRAEDSLVGIGDGSLALAATNRSVYTSFTNLAAHLEGDLRPARTNWQWRFSGYGSIDDRTLRDAIINYINNQ